MEIDIYVVMTITAAMLVRSTFGFGDAIFAVPILGVLTNLQVGVPVLAAVGSTITIVICATEFRKIEWKSLGSLLISSVIGIPIGVYILAKADTAAVLLLLGGIVTLFSAFTLFLKRSNMEIDSRFSPLFGFAGGVLGGAFNMYGLPIAMYGGLRKWSPAQFRLLISSFFLPTGLIGIAGHWYAGLWNGQFRVTYLAAVLPAIGAMYAGKWLNGKIHPERFNKLIWIMVMTLGMLLAFRNLHALELL